MIYSREKDGIKILSRQDFVIKHILECGQVFCYKREGDKYLVFPQDKYAEISETQEGYFIKTNDVDYFINYFDLDRDYSLIKRQLGEFEILKNPLEFGHGIRIINQDLFETTISFLISSNNNIKRIMLILNNIRQNLGEKIEKNAYSFPNYQKLLECDEKFFKDMGAGYRAKYIYNLLRQVTPKDLESMRGLETTSLRNKLISLSGIGPKVADCVLLFGYHKEDVFPVDTWIEKMYNTYYAKEDNRELIRKNLVKEFGSLSGYAQQYLFYYQRSSK